MQDEEAGCEPDATRPGGSQEEKPPMGGPMAAKLVEKDVEKNVGKYGRSSQENMWMCGETAMKVRTCAKFGFHQQTNAGHVRSVYGFGVNMWN